MSQVSLFRPSKLVIGVVEATLCHWALIPTLGAETIAFFIHWQWRTELHVRFATCHSGSERSRSLLVFVARNTEQLLSANTVSQRVWI